MFHDEGVGCPAVDVGGQRCGTVEDEFFGVTEVFASVVEVDDEDGVIFVFAGQEAEVVGAPPILGEVGVRKWFVGGGDGYVWGRHEWPVLSAWTPALLFCGDFVTPVLLGSVTMFVTAARTETRF